MRPITIVGAGQAGLQLGLALLRHNYPVTIISDRTPDEILHGWSTGSAGLFPSSLELEESLDCNTWNDSPGITSLWADFYGPDGQALTVVGDMEAGIGRAVDQRLKHSHWLRQFEARGGRVLIQVASPPQLDAYAQESDLLVIATGARQLGNLFERDADRSPFDSPQRHLMQFNLFGVKPWQIEGQDVVRLQVFPTLGEIIGIPFYSHTEQPCFNLLIEAVPGTLLDCFQEGNDGYALLERCKAMLRDFLPETYEHIKHAELTDERGWLRGALTPTVRKPVGTLPSGALALALGDTAILNDPIGAQGANTATKYAHFLAERIVARGEQPFDREWMEETFERFWDYAQYATLFNNALLMPPPPHVQQVIFAASHNARVAADYAGGFNHPPSLFPWLADPAATAAYLTAQGVSLAPN